MKKVIALFSAVIMCLSFVACGQTAQGGEENDGENDFHQGADNTEIGESEPKDETDENEITSSTPEEKMTLEQAEEIAEDLTGRFYQSILFGICCDLEYNEEDMSRYLTASQKGEYYGFQYKIGCCQTKEEVKEHILKTMDDKFAENLSEEAFFSDGEGNLYFLIAPMGLDYGYDEISIVEYSPSKIIAEMPLVDVDGPLEESFVFVIEKDSDVYKIIDMTIKEN